MAFSKEIQSITLAAGADMVGFAPVERFETGPDRIPLPAPGRPEGKRVIGLSSTVPPPLGR